MRRATPIVIGLLLSVCALCVSAQDDSTEGKITPPRITNRVGFGFPEGLRLTENITSGSATVAFMLDESGKPSQFVCIEASHIRMYEAAVDGIRRSTWAPAMEDGKPIPVRTSLKCGMEADRNVVNLSVLDDIMGLEILGRRDAMRVGLVNPKELDSPLSFVVPPKPMVLVDDSGKRITGKVEVEFYLDFDGNVCLPRAVKYDNELLAAAAIDSLMKARFAPPTFEKRPATVRVRFPFRFDEEPAAKAE